MFEIREPIDPMSALLHSKPLGEYSQRLKGLSLIPAQATWMLNSVFKVDFQSLIIWVELTHHMRTLQLLTPLPPAPGQSREHSYRKEAGVKETDVICVQTERVRQVLRFLTKQYNCKFLHGRAVERM